MVWARENRFSVRYTYILMLLLLVLWSGLIILSKCLHLHVLSSAAGHFIVGPVMHMTSRDTRFASISAVHMDTTRTNKNKSNRERWIEEPHGINEVAWQRSVYHINTVRNRKKHTRIVNVVGVCKKTNAHKTTFA